MDPHYIAASDALALLDNYETVSTGARECLQAVIDAKPLARALLLDTAESRLEFLECIEQDARERKGISESLQSIRFFMARYREEMKR